jgi:XTP/dITP diphosphohydrolase
MPPPRQPSASDAFGVEAPASQGREHRRLEGGRLVLATHNAGKVREVADLLAPWGFELVSAGALGLPEPAETDETFVGNARIKALAAARAAALPALADDSGFCVAALDGAPGVRTADWAETPTGRDYAIAMAKVEKLARHAGDRRGKFCCALVLAWPDGQTEEFLGEAHGRWVWPPRGTRGFGFDPMFVPDGEHETFGEMDPARKHAISHRAAAFRLLAEALLPARP